MLDKEWDNCKNEEQEYFTNTLRTNKIRTHSHWEADSTFLYIAQPPGYTVFKEEPWTRWTILEFLSFPPSFVLQCDIIWTLKWKKEKYIHWEFNSYPGISLQLGKLHRMCVNLNCNDARKVTPTLMWRSRLKTHLYIVRMLLDTKMTINLSEMYKPQSFVYIYY